MIIFIYRENTKLRIINRKLFQYLLAIYPQRNETIRYINTIEQGSYKNKYGTM